jgi:hypothetical protein
MTHPHRTLETLAGGEDRLRAFNYLVPTVVGVSGPSTCTPAC